MNNILSSYAGIPIIVIPDKKVQKRKHKRKRINKKWLKRYGYNIIPSPFEDDKIISMDGKLYMNSRTYQVLLNTIEKENKNV